MSRLHRPKAGAFIRFWVMLLIPIDKAFFRVRWHDLNKVPPPESGGVILALNHLAQIDTILMARMVWESGRIPRFLVKAPVFDWPIIGKLQAGAGQIPVHRGTTAAVQALRDAAKALEAGECVVIYPEGTTTKDPDGWPMQAKTGIARLALLAPDVPVVPIGQWGVQKRPGPLWKRVVRRAFTGRPLVQVSVGDPVDLSRFHGAKPSGETMREMSAQIMSAVRDEVAKLRGERAPAEFFVPDRVYVDKHAKT
jgi:1-acyl-sn-glycerol-3-phosphate acyltransferase